MKNICVFCGSKHGIRPQYSDNARLLAHTLVKHKIGLVYGGGTVGLMGEIARTVQDGLGPDAVFGVIPEALAPREISDTLIGRTHVVTDMHERKAMMARNADGFIAMPGGLGTLEELMEVMTWQQLGFHAKPIGLLNTEGFYDPLLSFFSHCIQEGFVKAEHQNIIVSADPEQLVQQMLSWQPPATNLLLEAKQRAAAIGEDISKTADDK